MIGSWILVIYVYAGMLSKGDSVAMTTAHFSSKELCEQAGKEADKLVAKSVKDVRYLCFKTGYGIGNL